MAKSTIAAAVAALLALAGPASAARTLRTSGELGTLAQQLVTVLDTISVENPVGGTTTSSPSPESSTVEATAYTTLGGAPSPSPSEAVFEVNPDLVVSSSPDATLSATAYTTSPPTETVYTSLSDLLAGESPDGSPVVVVEAVGESPEGYYAPETPVTLFV